MLDGVEMIAKIMSTKKMCIGKKRNKKRKKRGRTIFELVH